MESTAVLTQQAATLCIRSGGSTLKGSARDENSEYICHAEFPGSSRIRGLYGIARGLSGDVEEASEFCIQTLKQCIRDIKESDSINGSSLLPGCLEGIHSTLLGKNRFSENGHLSASLICAYIEGETAHIAVAGGGAAYLIDGEKISRLTEEVYVQDLDSIDPALLRPGRTPVGHDSLPLKPLFASQPIKPGNTLLFCSDSFVARVDALTILNTIDRASSPDEAADMLTQEAFRKGSSEDIGVVIVALEEQENGKAQSGEQNSDQRRLYAFKYMTVAALLLVLGYIFSALSVDNRSNSGRVSTFTEKKSGASVRTRIIRRDFSIGQLKGPFAEIRLQVVPGSARLFVDGLRQAGESPFTFIAPADRDVEIRVEAEGYETFEERFRPEQNAKIERIVKLAPSRPANGSLLIICRPKCDSLELDGRDIKGFPRDEMLMREISPGPHRIQAHSGTETEGRSLRIEYGVTQSIVFRFAGEKITDNNDSVPGEPASKTTGNNARTPTSNMPDVVNTRPETETPDAASRKRDAGENAENIEAPALKETFFNVDTNVDNCSMMVFRNDTLILTGFSGTRYDLKPDRYLIFVSKPGYKEQQREVVLDKEFQMVHFDLERE
jgi:serine/threonine protein phosphatase PrpC